MCEVVENYAKRYAKKHAKEYAKEYIKEQAIETAKVMIQIGITDADISRATKLTIEEVSELRAAAMYEVVS